MPARHLLALLGKALVAHAWLGGTSAPSLPPPPQPPPDCWFMGKKVYASLPHQPRAKEPGGAYQKLAEDQMEPGEAVLEKPASPVIVRCGQYNVLASYLGDNRQPWFLHGLSTLTQDRRSKIIEKFYERDESGRYKNVGWPRWAEELMTAEEQQLVEEEHERHFKWEARKERLLQRIVALDADVLSLVELDRWEDWFAPALKQHGYSSIWCKRPRETSHDGCAVFWRDPFSLIAHKSIEFIDRADPVTGRTYKDRVCIFALLQTTCGQRMLFLSTHLARNPDDPTMDRIRVRETAQLLYALTAFAREHGAIDAPVVMAGDFNTTNFRQLAAAARTLFELSHETVHPFVFNAFAAASQPTSVTACRKMCIDYIFFEPSKLELLEVLDQPALECCKPIPNAEHPSDHLPVLLTMRFRPSAYHQVHLARAWAQMLLSHDGISDVLDESQCSVPPEKRLERPLASTQLDAAFDFFAGSCATHDSIGEEALVARFRSLGSDLAPHAPALVKILREASVPADGEPFPPLSRSTFRDCYLHALRMQERSSRDVQWAFAFFDADGSGRLRHEELRTGFAALFGGGAVSASYLPPPRAPRAAAAAAARPLCRVGPQAHSVAARMPATSIMTCAGMCPAGVCFGLSLRPAYVGPRKAQPDIMMAANLDVSAPIALVWIMCESRHIRKPMKRAKKMWYLSGDLLKLMSMRTFGTRRKPPPYAAPVATAKFRKVTGPVGTSIWSRLPIAAYASRRPPSAEMPERTPLLVGLILGSASAGEALTLGAGFALEGDFFGSDLRGEGGVERQDRPAARRAQGRQPGAGRSSARCC
ncbi:hypothetical protein EMIHUDRAFT_101445 [Emiliania huxleyi CCMP1516]|uniref:EF-hand domain-containing protein n=2 Tax=Emiliania huxleyi TaxID=2903 RepID=A0A0D3JFN5_EMIH1|nr:hypothetical protein EMIHUDRAFT_101445 [Emiliania huxleyi CCMP1516]EOD22320.1 hypothetical protein EMIHUDRAFT_101445 [Emiliania huxleyi CCMP1516]|eukprot:XP_005774749.1 hypothetical protein EMIHUDRAFT_101445 [Emiliania huxleyi CCMP1516]